MEENADCREALSQVIATALDVKAAAAAKRAWFVFMVTVSECTRELIQVAADALLILSARSARLNGQIAGYVSQSSRQR